MSPEITPLWDRIQTHQIDDGRARLSFLARLARDNGWTVAYAGGAIQEYKRFVYLACTAGHPVTPSDQVDQVWHLHLLYTHNYWDEFCRKALEQDLHHGPTVGGTEAREMYTDWYGKTLEAYAKTFGHAAPPEYWPHPTQRMAETEFVRVNTHQNFIVPKSWRRWLPSRLR